MDSILGYVVLLCISLLISDLKEEETVAEKTTVCPVGWSVSGSLAWSSGSSFLQQCWCIPGSSQLASSSLSVLQMKAMYFHFCNSITTYRSCCSSFSNWHVSPWVVPLIWHPLTKVSELHSQQIRTRTKVESSRDKGRNSNRNSSMPCFPP